MKNYEMKTYDFHGTEMTAAFNFAGQYIGNEERANYLDQRGIAPELAQPDHRVCSIGFCEQEQKWYGWSHRAMYGFGIGSEVKPGDCAYVADTPEGLIEDHVNFFKEFGEEKMAQRRAECQILSDRSGIRILHSPLVIPVVDSLDDLEEALDDQSDLKQVDIMKDAWSIRKCGRGTWTAQTLDDARQMACDFAKSVS